MEADSGASAGSNNSAEEMLGPWPSAWWKPRGGKASSLGMGNEEGTGGLTMITNFSDPTIHEDGPGRGLRHTNVPHREPFSV